MAQKLILIVAACFALTSGALVRREAAGAGGLEDIQKHATEFQKTFTEGLNALVNSKSSQDLTKALKEGSDSVLQQLSSFSTSLQAAIGEANGKAKEVLEQARTNVERAMEDMRQKHPEVEKGAKELKTKISGAVNTAFEESQKVAKEVAASMDATNKKLAPQFQQAFQALIKGTEEMQKKLHEAATKQ